MVHYNANECARTVPSITRMEDYLTGNGRHLQGERAKLLKYLQALALHPELPIESLPPLFAAKNSIHETLNPNFTPGLFRVTSDMKFLGLAQVRTRHGILPAAVIESPTELFLFVLTPDFATLDNDVFKTNTYHELSVQGAVDCGVYQNFLKWRASEMFADTSCDPRPLPSTSFAVVNSRLAALCLDIPDTNFLGIHERSIFQTVLEGAPTAPMLTPPMAGSPPLSITVICQRVSPTLNLPPKRIINFHAAPVSAIRYMACLDGVNEIVNCMQAKKMPISSIVNKYVLPKHEPYQINSTLHLRPVGNVYMKFLIDTNDCNFLHRVACLLLRDIECAWIKDAFNYTYNETISQVFSRGSNWVKKIRQIRRLFSPMPTFLVKTDHLTRAHLVFQNKEVEICLDEAWRLMGRHGNIVCVDLVNNEVFRVFYEQGSRVFHTLCKVQDPIGRRTSVSGETIMAQQRAALAYMDIE